MLLALGPLSVDERPADAFDQLGREVRVGDVRRSDALLELEAAWIVLGRDLALGLRAGNDDDAWHQLLAFGVKWWTQDVRPRFPQTGCGSKPATGGRGRRSDSTLCSPVRAPFAGARYRFEGTRSSARRVGRVGDALDALARWSSSQSSLPVRWGTPVRLGGRPPRDAWRTPRWAADLQGSRTAGSASLEPQDPPDVPVLAHNAHRRCTNRVFSHEVGV